MDKFEIAVFANGCFWCTEAIFSKIKGVKKVVSGYTGGKSSNPSYEEVSSGTTGHAEAILIEFDERIISYEKLVEIFFKTHNPTTLNRQGNDVGTQYRSAIFYNSIEQKKIAEKVRNKLESENYFTDPIVTEITELKKFYPAEDYHQSFYEKNGDYPYCKIIIDPKIKKFLNEYSYLTK